MSDPRERRPGATGSSGSTLGYEQGDPGMTQGYQQPGQPGQPGMTGTQPGQPGMTGTQPAMPEAAYQRPAGQEPQSPGRRMAVASFTGLAGLYMLLSGLASVVIGIVGLGSGNRVFSNPTYTFRYGIHGWGWMELILGCVIFAAGVCVFLGMAWARIVGAVLATISAVANFAFIPHQPLWSITLIAIDALVIWALLTPRRPTDPN